MSVNKVNPDGSLSRLAGRGTVEYGASTVRTGTATFTIPAGDIVGTAHTTDEIAFDTPMPDTNYIVVLSCTSQSKYGNYKLDVHEGSKTKTGFKINYALVNDSSSVQNTITVTYVAFKLHSVEGLEKLENSIANFDAVMPENASADNQLVTQEDIADSGWKAWTTVVSDGSSINYSYTADKDAEFVVNWWCTGSTGYIYIHVNNVMVHALNIGVGGVQATAFQPIHAGDTIKIQLTGGINGNVKRRLHN